MMDYGANIGGTLIDLVMQMTNVMSKKQYRYFAKREV